MKSTFSQLFRITLFIVVSTTGLASDEFDQQRPGDISEQKWSSLRMAVQEAKLLPEPEGINVENGIFGRSVSLSGNRALVGAAGDDERGGDSGAAYMFEFNGIEWVRGPKFLPLDLEASDRFGTAVVLSGDRAFVGATGDDDHGSDSGAVYVYVFDGNNWSQNQKITPDDGAINDQFGNAISTFDDRVVVGAFGANDYGFMSGAAYVFEFDGLAWNQSQKLLPTVGDENNHFGDSVSLATNRILIGAYGDSDNGAFSGAAYFFDYDGNSWVQSQKLTASDGSAVDYFGGSVSLHGNRALIGASGTDNNGPQTGSVYAFDYNGVSWVQRQKLSIGFSSSPRYFGGSVSVLGDRVLVGAREDGVSGAAYIYDYDGTGWQFNQRITPSDGSSGDSFGFSISLSETRVLVGSYQDDDNGNNSGSAYVFNLDPQYAVNVSVTGLAGGTLNLSNGEDNLAISVDGTQTLSVLSDGSAFDVDITAQPTMPNQVCSFTSADAGALNGLDATVSIDCETTQYDININVSGLLGDAVSFSNDGDTLTVNTNGVHTISTFDDGSAYLVTVVSQPTEPSQSCVVSSPMGNLNGGDVVLTATCITNQYSVGGHVTGLANGNFVTLSINGGDEYLVVDDNDFFDFNNSLEDQSSYTVTVLFDPTTPNQTCAVTNGDGTLMGTNVMDVEVDCEINQYFIGGYVTGLIEVNNMVLQNNGGDDSVIAVDGAFTFPTPLDDQQSYVANIYRQPTNPIQLCEVFNATGILNGDDVVNVFISCEFGGDLIYRHGFDTTDAISEVPEVFNE